MGSIYYGPIYWSQAFLDGIGTNDRGQISARSNANEVATSYTSEVGNWGFGKLHYVRYSFGVKILLLSRRYCRHILSPAERAADTLRNYIS